MKATISRLPDGELQLIKVVQSDMAKIQHDIDEAMVEYNDLKAKLAEAKEKIKPLKDKLVPLSQMCAGIANPKSRDKYFPDLTKQAFLDHVEDHLNG